MPDAAWKAHERECARRLGGKRAGPLGKRGSDVTHPLWAVECKERKALPAWLKSALAQSVKAARADQLPLVVLHELGARHDGDVVCLRLKDFEQWFGLVTRALGQEA